MEAAFETRFADTCHDPLCVTPPFVYEDAKADTPKYVTWKLDENNLKDGAEYRKKYLQHAQFVFSRVQHHVHRKTKKGKCVKCKAGG